MMCMNRLGAALAFFCSSLVIQVGASSAQTNLTMLGGATGADVYCLQVGDLNTGVFVGTYFQTGTGTWDAVSKFGAAQYQERKRDPLVTEIYRNATGGMPAATVQFDFVSKTVKSSSAAPSGWEDRFIILSGTNQATSKDCLDMATAPGAPGGPPIPPGSGAAAQSIVFPPKTIVIVAPGTEITAFAGPPCPTGFGKPGDMLCPGKKACHPPGTFCMPAGGFCPQGTFGEPPFGFTCVSMSDPRMCPTTSDAMKTGIASLCAPGLRCAGPNPATPCIP